MVTLLSDLHFWTLREDVVIKDADIGAYRYQEKGGVNKERVYYDQRKQFIESRCGTLILKNTRPLKLRDSLKELEETLAKERIVWQGWTKHDQYQLSFTSGLIVVITIDTSTGDITSVVFDKYLQGKLLSDNVTDGAFTFRYIIFTYNDSRATLIHLAKKTPDEGGIGRSSSSSSSSSGRLSTADAKVVICEGIGPSGRRFERKCSINTAEDMVAFWWKSGHDEVYPWTPLKKDLDRANLMVFTLSGSSLSLSCYCRTEMTPLSIKFSRLQPDVILTVEQGFDRKGGVTVLSCVYKVKNGSLNRISVTSIPLEAPLTSHAHNPSETRLLLACNNGVLALHCESRGMTHVTKAGLIPSCISWLNCGSLLFVSNERGQLQCFDMALSLVRIQLLLESYSPQRILDISEYFYHQQLLETINWGPANLDTKGPSNSPDIPPLFIQFANGPLACLRIGTATPGGANETSSVGSNKPTEVSPSLLISQYAKHSQFDEAINLLVSLNWETHGDFALRGLSTIVRALLKLPLTAQREAQLEAALASFLVPAVALSEEVDDEFGPPVRALTRKFFFRILRQGSLEKAYRLALDLKDHDCFLSAHRVARLRGNKRLASLALQNARDLESGSSSSCSGFSCSDEGSSSSCSVSCGGGESCSTCSSSGAEDAAPESGTTGGKSSAVALAAPSSSPPYQSDGVITINIRQGPQEEEEEDPPVGDPSIRRNPPIPAKDRTTPSQLRGSSSYASGHPGQTQQSRTVRDVYYSDVNKKFINEEKLAYFVDKSDLQKQYEQAVFQEVTTEEEDGGTVKVVHFGVV